MKVFIYVIAATVLEATGDSIIRIAIRPGSTPARIGLFVLGTVLLAAYGTSLNLAPVDFAALTGLYIAILFISFQITNYIFFHVAPTVSTLIGGVLIVGGGAIVYHWR